MKLAHGITIKLSLGLLIGAKGVSAHCPLCTLGAAVAAGGATYLGVKSIVIGLLLGAFAVSMGWWIARMIKKQVIKFQSQAIILLSFITTVLPLKPLFFDYHSLYIPWVGAYGLTIAIDYFFVGTLLGALIVSIAPTLSRKLSMLNNGKVIPYQGILLTFGLLAVAGLVLQFTT